MQKVRSGQMRAFRPIRKCYDMVLLSSVFWIPKIMGSYVEKISASNIQNFGKISLL